MLGALTRKLGGSGLETLWEQGRPGSSRPLESCSAGGWDNGWLGLTVALGAAGRRAEWGRVGAQPDST